MIPIQIEEIFQEHMEGDYYIFLKRIDDSTEILFLNIEIQVPGTDSEDAIMQRWTIEVKGHRKSRFELGYCSSLELLEDNPLLWEFTDVHGELYFNGNIDNWSKLFYELFVVHKDLFDHHIPFDISLGGELTGFNQYRFSNGLVAKGPHKLLHQYGRCLENNGLTCSIVGNYKLTFWNGREDLPETGKLKVLLLGHSFLIAEEFKFIQA